MEQQNNTIRHDDMLQFKDFLSLCLRKWYWFALSVIVCLGAALFYILKTPPEYIRSAEILIKNDRKGKSAVGGDQFVELGLFSTNTNITDEIMSFSSKSNMMEVVRRLQLNMDYEQDGTFHKKALYSSSLPVVARLEDVDDNQSASFTLVLKASGGLLMKEFSLQGKSFDRGAIVTGTLNDTIQTPIGNVVIAPTIFYEAKDYQPIYIKHSGLYSATGRFSSKLTVNRAGEKTERANVIRLSFRDISIPRAEDVLNTLVNVYNENWIKDKNQIATSTSMFINDRLAMIETELASVDNDISSYKSANLLPDVAAASSMYMNQSREINNQVLELNNELYMTRYIRTYLSNEGNKNQLLPANSGIQSGSIEAQIKDYNTKMLERNNLVATTSTVNPLVVDLDSALDNLRKAIMISIDNQILALNTQISNLQRTEKNTTSKLAASPTQAKYLLSVERQQSVKEALYLFLLQKREENELSQAFTAYNTRVIDPPTGSSSPIAPSKSKAYLIALLLGLFIPIFFIYLIESLNSTIRSKKDLKNMTMPFLGEIPLYEEGGKRHFKKKNVSCGKLDIVVNKGNRNVINEAFRILRTNIEFMGKGSNENVTIITSYDQGSGKSFIALNTAAALAIKNKKVLLIDGDLRHASTSKHISKPKSGLSDYLSDQIQDIRSVIVTHPDYPYLDILPVGTIPPNPTELIATDLFEEAIKKLKKQYDYVLIDCPPIDIMADTQLIAQYTDRTIFIARAGLLDKSQLPELEKTYKEGRYRKMALVLNGTTADNGSYKYGYKNGYKYAGDCTYYVNS